MDRFVFFLDLEAVFWRGTLAPLARASESAMAIACLRLFTFFFERPERSVPVFFSSMTRLTVLPTEAPYFLRLAFFLAAMAQPACVGVLSLAELLLSKFS